MKDAHRERNEGLWRERQNSISSNLRPYNESRIPAHGVSDAQNTLRFNSADDLCHRGRDGVDTGTDTGQFVLVPRLRRIAHENKARAYGLRNTLEFEARNTDALKDATKRDDERI